MTAPLELPIRRTRERRAAVRFARGDGEGSKQWVAERVVDFFNRDTDSRQEDTDLRLQRYAKYRQWTEGKTWPFENSSDISLPDMTEDSLRSQDMLHNAVMSFRPVVTASAIKKSDIEKERTIDVLLDTQFFDEQNGEKLVEEMAEQFINEGTFVNYVTWVREDRKAIDVRIFEPIPDEAIPREYFLSILKQAFADDDVFEDGEESWDWRVEHKSGQPDSFVKFYTTDDGDVEMVTKTDRRVFDGPKVIAKSYQQVLTPPRVSNLQIPSPSNPGGAPHVILVDHPTIEELRVLKRRGFYDLMTKKDMDEIENLVRQRQWPDESRERQVDALAGKSDVRDDQVPRHRTLTRLVCFDIYDIDGDGEDEDVVWWVLLESKSLLKAMPLTEMWPFEKPMRPLAEAAYLPVKDRREGMSLLELTEGLHDFAKMIFDQTVDAGTIASFPFGFYRPTSSLNPEAIRIQPLDLVPLNDPQSDVNFPTIPNQSQAFGVNMLTVVNQMRERLTLQGDLQAGRVPTGKASALRTASATATILAQGEARPERILRRFFMGVSKTFQMMHELNRKLLPDGKKFHITGTLKEGEDPYREIEKADREIDATVKFSFGANVQNASKLARQQGLEQAGGAIMNPLMLQMGIVTPDNVYRWARDFVESLGQNSANYISPPTKTAPQPVITAEDAVDSILDTRMPAGLPLEGSEQHLARVQAIIKERTTIPIQKPDGGEINEKVENLALFTQAQTAILRAYMEQISQLIAQEKQAQETLRAASEQGQQGRAQEANGGQPIGGNPRVEENELLDETLPGAGGGANTQ